LRKLPVILACIFALAAPSLAAHADTISTFHLYSANYDGHIDGILEINTTTGQPGYGSFTMFVNAPPRSGLPNQQFSFSGLFSPAECNDCEFAPSSLSFSLGGYPRSFLYLEVPLSTLVDYTGGPLCSGLYAHPCYGGGSGSYYIAADSYYFNSIQYIGNANLDLLSTVQTVEPSTFVLLGSGALGLLGVAKRKFIDA